MIGETTLLDLSLHHIYSMAEDDSSVEISDCDSNSEYEEYEEEIIEEYEVVSDDEIAVQNLSIADTQHPESKPANEENDDSLWEKPSWAKGGVKLRQTGRGEAMKKDGNLAAPITFTPFKNNDHSNAIANQGRLKKTAVGNAVKQGESLAAPITFTPFKNEDHRNYVADPNKLKSSETGQAVREGANLAMPITHIRKGKK